MMVSHRVEDDIASRNIVVSMEVCGRSAQATGKLWQCQRNQKNNYKQELTLYVAHEESSLQANYRERNLRKTEPTIVD